MNIISHQQPISFSGETLLPPLIVGNSSISSILLSRVGCLSFCNLRDSIQCCVGRGETYKRKPRVDVNKKKVSILGLGEIQSTFSWRWRWTKPPKEGLKFFPFSAVANFLAEDEISRCRFTQEPEALVSHRDYKLCRREAYKGFAE